VTSDQGAAAEPRALLAALETISRSRPDRVLRLLGTVAGADAAGEAEQPFELLIFRGFSSSTTHPTGFDPDQPVLPEGVRIETAELLEGPLNPAAERILAGPALPREFLVPGAWC
jgi:hypothetical protein